MTKQKTNAATIEDAGKLVVQHDPQAQPSSENPSPEQQKDAIAQALSLLAYACTLEINIPDPNGDREVDYVSDEQNGEIETVRCRVANRFGKMQRGLLNQVMRQLDFAKDQALKELDGVKRDIASALRNLQRSEDPTKLRDFLESKTSWADVVRDQVAHAQMLRDAADAAYLDLMGRPYTPYEQRAKRVVTIPAPAAGEPVDPVLAKAKALLEA